MPQSKAEMNKHMKAGDLLWKLGEHPAIPSIIAPPLSLIEIFINIVCKNGHVEPHKGCIEIWDIPKNYKKYKKEFDEEYSHYSSEELKQYKGGLVSVDIPYEKVYGYPWKADHIEYWGEMCFMVFIGKNMKLWTDRKNWQHMAGVEVAGRTFEEMIIKLGAKFYKTFGNFTGENFLTSPEKSNHKKEKHFFEKPIKHKNLKAYRLIKNPKYKDIPISEINRRWVEWFSKTSYGKKRWMSTLKDVLAGKKSV